MNPSHELAGHPDEETERRIAGDVRILLAEARGNLRVVHRIGFGPFAGTFLVGAVRRYRLRAVGDALDAADRIVSTDGWSRERYGGLLAGLRTGWTELLRGTIAGPGGRMAVAALLRDLDAAVEGLTLVVRPAAPPRGGRTIARIRRHEWVAVLLTLACFTGAAMILAHWWGTSWDTRAAELGGKDAFTLLAAEVTDVPGRASGYLVAPAGLLLLASGGLLGTVVFTGWLGKRLAGAAGWILVALAPLHLLETWLLHQALSGGRSVDEYASWLQAVAFAGYALAPAAGAVAVLCSVIAMMRIAATSAFRRRLRKYPWPGAAFGWRHVPGSGGDTAHWFDSSATPAGRDPDRLGICLSGGGIRSSTFALGALQALQTQPLLDGTRGRSELTGARYLAAVSGGSYTAGAFLLGLRHPATARDSAGLTAVDVDADHLFQPDSPEFDHLRRHSSYIADGVREWVVALLVVLRGALLSTLLLGLMALTAGRWAGFLHHATKRAADLENPFYPVWGAVAATAAVAGLALLLWVVSHWFYAPEGEPAWHQLWHRRLVGAARVTCVAFAVMVVVGAVVPIATAVSMRVIDATGGLGISAGEITAGMAKGGVLGFIGVATTVLGLLNNRRNQVMKAAREAQQKSAKLSVRLGDIGRRALNWTAVYAGLAMIAAVYTIVFGFATYTTATVSPEYRPKVEWGTPDWTSPWTTLQITLFLTAVVVALFTLLDETALGLHPFYRRRLARAFAVRRFRRLWHPGQPPGFEAHHYPWDEATGLSYCRPRDGVPFPQVIFCGAAHCSDPDRTPPGRHALAYTFSHDAIGGPDVGWCDLEKVRPYLPKRLRADLTVQAAMAVSGAAFASAAHPFYGAANVILALTNARLGIWTVNPRTFDDAGRDWWRARPPMARRLSYLIREIYGWYPAENPLMFVSDGALYDNIGLVELLRHRCTRIYCFDATSDAEGFATSLARSLALARDELGVEVSFEDPDRADPKNRGTRTGDGDLAGRVADQAVIVGHATYPALEPGYPPATAVIVIGRATLDTGTPWEVRRHAAHSDFPHDATGDQWFDADKFNAYTSLGRHVGDAAVQAMKKAARVSTATAPVRIKVHPGL